MTRFFLLSGCFTILAALAVAADAPDAATAAKKQYDAAVTEQQKKFDAAVQDAIDDYTKKLDEMAEKAKEAGNLDGSLAIKAEQERVARRDSGRKSGKLPADAAKAKKQFETAFSKLKADAAQKRREILAGFIRELTDIEQFETKGDKLASATAVKAFRLEMEKAGARSIEGNLALDKARDVFAKSATEAENKLLQQFDTAIKTVTDNKKLPAEQKAALLDAVKAEKKRFEDRGLIPWSEPMLPAMHVYLQSLRAAQTVLHKSFDNEIEKAIKLMDDATVRDLRQEWKYVEEIAVIATWAQAAGTGAPGKVNFYSNGGLNVRDNKNRWYFDKNGKLVLRWEAANAPGGAWLDTVTIAKDGKTYAGQNQNGTKIRGTLVTD